MANLAQTVNVLQSVILTSDDRMVLTPTWHVFRMFRVHQDARLLTTDLKCEEYEYQGSRITALSASASVDNEGKIHVSMANLNPGKEITVTCPVIGAAIKTVTGEILTADRMNACNTFEKPETVKTVQFRGFKMKDGVITVILPAKSVVMLEVETK